MFSRWCCRNGRDFFGVCTSRFNRHRKLKGRQKYSFTFCQKSLYTGSGFVKALVLGKFLSSGLVVVRSMPLRLAVEPFITVTVSLLLLKQMVRSQEIFSKIYNVYGHTSRYFHSRNPFLNWCSVAEGSGKYYSEQYL